MHVREEHLLRRRMCAPVPFEGTLSLEEAMRDFELHVSGFDSYALYAPGSHPRTCLRHCMLGQHEWARQHLSLVPSSLYEVL